MTPCLTNYFINWPNTGPNHLLLKVIKERDNGVQKTMLETGSSYNLIKRCLLLGRKAMTNLDSTLKSRVITLPTKVHRVKAMDFPVVM